MEQIVPREHPKPWNNNIFYKKIKSKSIDYELDSKITNHIILDEEIILHNYRNKINEYEVKLTNGKNWEYYKKIINPYELVYTQKKYIEFPESVSILRPLSRSYFKMLEILKILNCFELFKYENIRTAHVCEGPGGFIEALFDEAIKNKKNIQSTIAMTLRSKQTNVPGWKRASQFLQKNRNIRILYGHDDTGNILKPENQQYFIDYSNNPNYGGKVNIFTADGGFDFSYDYSKQEEMIFPLLLASTKIGLEVLKKGGIFILKLFDFYHKSTVDLLCFLASHFTEWTLYKPAMSRPCNPEQYFIGKGFIGCSEQTLDIMRVWCSIIENNQPLESLFKSDYPEEFINTLDYLRKQSFNRQRDYLEKVFNIIDKNDDELVKSYLQNNIKYSYDWCQQFKVPIASHYYLVAD
jgi:23S rRNA U2552 (ribose-2'-O)-methylase RlmE/FtsJ